MDDYEVPIRIADYVLVYERPSYSGPEGDDEDEKQRQMEMAKLRHLYTMAMSAEGLEIEEEGLGKYVFVKIFCSFERLCQEAEKMKIDMALEEVILEDGEGKRKAEKGKDLKKKMKRILDMDDEADKICAPFNRKCMEWFIGWRDSDTFFWSALKSRMIHHILTNIDIQRMKTKNPIDKDNRRQGLLNLLMLGAYKDAFILHDVSALEPVILKHPQKRRSDVELTESVSNPSLNSPGKFRDTRKELTEKWVGYCKRQPLHLIRDYFGEKIAFYFAWVGTLISSLWAPTILGLIVFFFGVITRVLEGDQNMSGGKNGTNQTYQHNAMTYVNIIKSSSDNVLTPFFAFAICLWGTIMMEVWKRKQVTLEYLWMVENFNIAEPDRPQFYGTEAFVDPVTNQTRMIYPMKDRIWKYMLSYSVLIIMVIVVCISVTSVILYRLYSEVSLCAKGDTMCNMFHGTIIAATLNTISIMILGRIYETLAEKLTEWENHQTQSMYNDALIIKLFAFQFANTYASLFYTAFFRRNLSPNGIMGLGSKYIDNCTDDEQNNCMSLLSFQLLILMILKPVPKFFMDVIWPNIMKHLRRCGINQIGDSSTDSGHQHYLVKEMMKPQAEDFRLGEFTEKTIQYGYLMLFAASFPLAPLLGLIYNLLDLRIDANRLLWINRRPVPYRENDIGIWFNIINFINVLGVISNAFLIAFTASLGETRSIKFKFLFIVIFEHSVFLVKFLMTILIPDIPTSITFARRRQRFLLSRLMSLAAQGGGKVPKKDSKSYQNLSYASLSGNSYDSSR